MGKVDANMRNSETKKASGDCYLQIVGQFVEWNTRSSPIQVFDQNSCEIFTFVNISKEGI